MQRSCTQGPHLCGRRSHTSFGARFFLCTGRQPPRMIMCIIPKARFRPLYMRCGIYGMRSSTGSTNPAATHSIRPGFTFLLEPIQRCLQRAAVPKRRRMGHPPMLGAFAAYWPCRGSGRSIDKPIRRQDNCRYARGYNSIEPIMVATGNPRGSWCRPRPRRCRNTRRRSSAGNRPDSDGWDCPASCCPGDPEGSIGDPTR